MRLRYELEPDGPLKVLWDHDLTSSGRRPTARFVGMDVHRNRTQVCVLGNKGNEVRNRNVVNDRQSLRKQLAGLRKGTPVAVEAAHGRGWTAELPGDGPWGVSVPAG